MKNLSYFVRLCALSLTFVTSSITFAAGADVNEENTLIKDDIASAQVLTEMCPSLIGKNAKFDQNIKKMVSSSLNGYSDKSATFESLQKDAEYQSLLKDARTAAKEVDNAEQKTACEDILTSEA